MPTSEELVVAARSGDQVAFARIVEEDGPRAYRLARAILGSSQDAEEAVQEAFVHAWRELPRLRDAALWPAWFRRITVRAAIDRGRRRPRVREIDLGAHEPPPEPDASAAVADRDDVDRVLRGLSPDDRALLALRFLVDLEVDDVAAVLGIPSGTVKSRLSRLLARLQSGIEGAER
jgi:RNA polymerase sigma-70 factor (ECF subfamily)